MAAGAGGLLRPDAVRRQGGGPVRPGVPAAAPAVPPAAAVGSAIADVLNAPERLPLPLERFDGSLDVAPPALIRAYLRLGAEVLGPPAWDPDFNSADLPMMLRIDQLPARYRRHFLGA